MNFIIVGANGKIGRALCEKLSQTESEILKVSSKFNDTNRSKNCFDNLQEAFRHSPGQTHVIYLSYLKNPISNAWNLLRNLSNFRNHPHSNGQFIYFSTFSFNPNLSFIDKIERVPSYCSYPSTYNINKYICELILHLFSKVFPEIKDRITIVRPGIIFGENTKWSETILSNLRQKIILIPFHQKRVPAEHLQHFLNRLMNCLESKIYNQHCHYRAQMAIGELIGFHQCWLETSSEKRGKERFEIQTINYLGLGKTLSLQKPKNGCWHLGIVGFIVKKLIHRIYGTILDRRGVGSLPFELFYFQEPENIQLQEQ